MVLQTYSDYFATRILKINSQFKQLLYDVSVVILGSILLVLSSKINFVLPFTYVPVTMQTFAVLFLSMLFGRKAVYMVMLYIVEGLMGLPVFAKGGGLGYLLGPTGGYILGFLAASYICGLYAEYGYSKSFVKTFSVMLVGNLLIYICGVSILLFYTGFSILKALMLGVYPFIVGDILKIFIATLVLPAGWKLVK
jgi:biotin transport system substrate-specific component